MELILIRHARPEHIENADGPADPPLTGLGHGQSGAMAEWMVSETIDALYVSPLRRARETAAPLEAKLGLVAEVAEGVREYDAEDDTYIPLEILKADPEVFKEWLADHANEDRTAFTAEVVHALETIIGKHPGQQVAVVCHGGVINAYAAHVLGLGPEMFFEPGYTSVHRFLASSRGHRMIASLNETAHLRGVEA